MLALTFAALPLFVLAPSQDPRVVGRDAELIVRPDCADSLVDQADPQSCLQASSTPTLGMLYPLSTDFFVDALGRVGIGMTNPIYALDVTSDTLYGSMRVTSTSSGGAGVFGLQTGDGYGVRGRADGSDGTGVHGDGGYSGVSGIGDDYGVVGLSRSRDANFAGVRGRMISSIAGAFSAGVRGENGGSGTNGVGVYGEHSANGYGVFGIAQGSLGTGVVGSGTNYGVFSFGDLGVLGTKAFVQPHPTDSAQEIRFVCLEGNESGTYFRGSSRLVNGAATIEVPEDFRLVTELEGLTVQVTALGDARVWVEHKGLGRIEVRGRPDVEFDYFVNGVRRGFADFETLRPNTSMIPRFRDEPYAENLPTAVRDLMVGNGMLNADYTPNETTALRNGWELSDPAPAPREAIPPHDVNR